MISLFSLFMDTLPFPVISICFKMFCLCQFACVMLNVNSECFSKTKENFKISLMAIEKTLLMSEMLSG